MLPSQGERPGDVGFIARDMTNAPKYVARCKQCAWSEERKTRAAALRAAASHVGSVEGHNHLVHVKAVDDCFVVGRPPRFADPEWADAYTPIGRR